MVFVRYKILYKQKNAEQCKHCAALVFELYTDFFLEAGSLYLLLAVGFDVISWQKFNVVLP